jgi:hypothetical protein
MRFAALLSNEGMQSSLDVQQLRNHARIEPRNTESPMVLEEGVPEESVEIRSIFGAQFHRCQRGLGSLRTTQFDRGITRKRPLQTPWIRP